MNEILENFMARPLSHRIGFWVISLILVGGLFWQYSYSAKSNSLSDTQTRIDSLQSQIRAEKRIALRLDEFKGEVSKLEDQLQLALSQLPDRREIPGLLSSIETLARDTGLDVRRFAPQNDVLQAFYAEVPVHLELVGTFHQVASFFDEVANLSRIVNITQIRLSNPRGFFRESPSMTVDVSGLITTFRYLEESERVVEVEEVSRGRRRR
jgi:type IV pilus assembly protein PilO